MPGAEPVVIKLERDNELKVSSLQVPEASGRIDWDEGCGGVIE